MNDADIESYIYSTEYDAAFGNYTVPYYRGFSSIPGMKTVGYNRIFALHRGFSNSDNAQYGGKNSRLRGQISKNQANMIVPPTSPTSSFTSTAPTLISSAPRGDNRMFIIEAIAGRNTKVSVRRSRQVYTIPYSRLSETYQEIHKRGGRITKITPA